MRLHLLIDRSLSMNEIVWQEGRSRFKSALRWARNFLEKEEWCYSKVRISTFIQQLQHHGEEAGSVAEAVQTLGRTEAVDPGHALDLVRLMTVKAAQ